MNCQKLRRFCLPFLTGSIIMSSSCDDSTTIPEKPPETGESDVTYRPVMHGWLHSPYIILGTSTSPVGAAISISYSFIYR